MQNFNIEYDVKHCCESATAASCICVALFDVRQTFGPSNDDGITVVRRYSLERSKEVFSHLFPQLWEKLEKVDHGRPAMKLKLLAKPIAVIGITLIGTILFILLSQPNQPSSKPDPMARSFVLWLHGLGDSGPANEPIKTLFSSPEFRNTVWSFPSAPSNPVTCNCKVYTLCIYN